MTSGTLQQLDNIFYYLAVRMHLGSSVKLWHKTLLDTIKSTHIVLHLIE